MTDFEPQGNPHVVAHLIPDEAGTSRWLATLLDPQLPQAFRVVQQVLWDKFREHLAREGVGLQSPTPAKVVLGQVLQSHGIQREIDLALWWDAWWVIVENKIKRAAFKSGQFQEEYDLARESIPSREDSHPATRPTKLAFVLLAPRESIGKAALEALQMQPGDARVYMTWTQVLEWVQGAQSRSLESPPADAAALMFLARAGSQRIRELLTDPPIIGDEETYDNLMRIAKSVHEAIEHTWPSLGFSRRMKYRSWSDTEEGFVQLVFQLRGLKGRAVYLDLRAVKGAEGKVEIEVKLSLQVERSADRAVKQSCLRFLGGLKSEPICSVLQDMVGFGGGWEGLQWTRSRDLSADSSVTQRTRLSPTNARLARILIDHTLAFLIIFRPALEQQPGELSRGEA
jgi:hypothetical protein